MALRHAYAGVLVVLAGTYAKECAPLVLPNSNRTASAPCTGDEGSSCQFECSPGFTPVGSRLVCQNYTTKSGVNVLNREFWGARCERLCSGWAVDPSVTVARRCLTNTLQHQELHQDAIKGRCQFAGIARMRMGLVLR